MSVSIWFPDGTVIRGVDATDALVRLGRIQWTPTEDTATIKAALSDRAWGWNRSALNPALPDDQFLTALDASAMVAVIYGPAKAPKPPSPGLELPEDGS